MYRNRLIIFFLLCFGIINSMAQSPGDQIPLLIEKMKRANGNTKIDLLNEIAIEYRKTDRYQSIEYARQAFRLSESFKYLPGKALALKSEGICWFFIGNNDSAFSCYSQALDVYKQIADLKGVSACYNNMGLISQETGKYDEAMKLYRLSIEMDRKLGDSIGVATTLQNIADILIYRGEIKKAMTTTRQALQIYTDQSDKPGILASYSNLGAEYDYLGQFQEAIRNYEKTLNLARELKDRYQEIMVMGNIGIAYWHWQKSDSALKYLTIALEMSDENDEGYNIYTILKTMADIYSSQKQYVKSNEILQSILNKNLEVDNRRYVAVIMTSIGKNLIELNEVDKAIGYLDKSLELSTAIDAKFEMLDNYRLLIYAKSILRNFREADSFQNLHTNLHMYLKQADSLPGPVSRNTEKAETSADAPIVTDWIMAILMLVLVLVFGVFAFRKGN